MSAGVKRLVVVVGIVGMLAALFVYGILGDPTRRDDLPSALLNRPVPDFSTPLFELYQTKYGDIFDTTAIGNTSLVINFWAS